MPKQTQTINISTFSIIKIFLVFILLAFLFYIRDIVTIFFVALVFASALNPWVDWLNQKKIPRPLGILSIYLLILLVISLVVYLLIPPISKQIGEISQKFPQAIKSLLPPASQGFSFTRDVSSNLETLQETLRANASNIIVALKGMFGSVVSFFLVVVITFYMVVEDNALGKIIRSTVPLRHQPYVVRLLKRMQQKIGFWLRGQLILCFSIGFLTFIGLRILGVKYSLVLALTAGLTEFVPYLGPIIGAIPAIFLAYAQAPMLALAVAAFYYFVQFVENHILVPKVMQKAVGLNPVVSIIVLLIGFRLAGVSGAVLSIPVATAISVVLDDLFASKQAAEAVEAD